MRMHLVALAGLALLAGCQQMPGTPRLAPPPTGSIHDEKSMKETLRRCLPRGTPLADARQFMEQQGFSCALEKHSSFVEKGAFHGEIDFLYCLRSDPPGPAKVALRWAVAVVLEQDRVTEVFTDYSALPAGAWWQMLPGTLPGKPASAGPIQPLADGPQKSK